MFTGELELNKTYNIIYAAGKYEVEYANNVTCVKITKKRYYLLDNTNAREFYISNERVLEAKEV